jgi:hypothetical protein
MPVPVETAPPAAMRRAALWLAGILAILTLLPVWVVRYPALYDYQTHVLEAKVVARYDTPEFGYALHYQIRDDWERRSNALTTRLMIEIGRVVPIELSGKIVLSLSLALFAGGLALLLARLGRPPWLLLSLPLLAYNLTFTTGLMNWSFGLALIPWALLFYELWKRSGRLPVLLGLAAIGLLIYTAHVLAWGLFLLLVFALAAGQKLPLRKVVLLALAASVTAPLLLLTRPVLSAAPLAAAVGLTLIGAVIQRLNPPAWLSSTLAASGVALFAAGYLVWREPVRELFPDLGYSPYTKAISPLQLFSLPYYSSAAPPRLEIYNLTVLVLVGAALAVFLRQIWLAWRSNQPAAEPGWGLAIGLIAVAYFLTPTRTADIIVTEPRLLLTLVVAGLAGLNLPAPGSRSWTVLAGVLAALAVLAPVGTLGHALYYDSAARVWAGWLAEIPPNQRVLVFSDPLPTPPLLKRIPQVFDQHQFTSTYALERGGFASNTFFNGPLLPLDERAIPPYWWDEFRAGPYLEHTCQRLAPFYDYVVVWNLRSRSLQSALQDCFGEPVFRTPGFGLWQIFP